MRQLSGNCSDGRTCPKMFEDEGEIVVQGALEEAQEVTGVTNPGAGEAVVRVPREVFLEAARALGMSL